MCAADSLCYTAETDSSVEQLDASLRKREKVDTPSFQLSEKNMGETTWIFNVNVVRLNTGRVFPIRI